MRNTLYIVALAIVVTACILLVLFSSSGSIAGLEPDQFASLAQFTAIALLVGAALVSTRHRVNLRLWHGAAWLAVLVVLVVGYNALN